MKSFKKLISEVAQPKSEDEKNFKDKHVIEISPHPVALDSQHIGDTTDGVINAKTDRPKKHKRMADYKKGEDEAVYEGMDLDGEGLAQRLDRARKMELKQKIYDEAKLDPVGQEDDDIDNDGDVDDSDAYLHNRRKVIKKAMKESLEKITEKAKSEAQQKAAAIALAVKRGEKPKSELFGAAKEMYKMSAKDLEDYASTKHDDIPYKVDEAKTDIYHKHMLKALAKSRLPKDHQYTSSIANNGDFVVFDGSSRIVGRIKKGEHDLKESAFVAKAAYAKKDNKKSFELGKKKFPVTIKKDVADEITEDLTENFKTGSVKLNDGSSVLLKKQDADLMNQMFADLNPGNRKKMMKVAMTDKAGFEEILGFAREAM